jgi:ABC-type transport system substrate-binding protein
VGGYTADKVALRRAIALAVNIEEEIRAFWRGQAVPAQSSIMPGLIGYDPAFTTDTHDYDLPRAKALLDLYGYLDRDGDGWREAPDGSPLVLEMSTQADQQARQRDELWRKNMFALGIRIEFKPAQWPENLKNARAGKLMMWMVSTSAAAPDGLPGLDRGATIHFGGQNMARFKSAEFDAIYDRLRRIPDGPERQRLFFEAKRILATYMPYRCHVHRIVTDLAHPWLIGYRRPPFWQSWWHYADIDLDAQAKAAQ